MTHIIWIVQIIQVIKTLKLMTPITLHYITIALKHITNTLSTLILLSVSSAKSIGLIHLWWGSTLTVITVLTNTVNCMGTSVFTGTIL